MQQLPDLHSAHIKMLSAHRIMLIGAGLLELWLDAQMSWHSGCDIPAAVPRLAAAGRQSQAAPFLQDKKSTRCTIVLDGHEERNVLSR